MRADSSSDYNPRLLVGQRVMVARPELERGTGCADPLAEQRRTFGAEVVVQPVLRIEPPADWRPVDDALDNPSNARDDEKYAD